MKKLILTMVLVLGVATSGWALTFDLTQVINGSNPLTTASPSWGTITLTDNGNSVDVKIDLIGSGLLKIQSVDLNYNDANFSNSSAFTITGSTVGVNENHQQADGYTTGKFDLQIPQTGSFGNVYEPYFATISLAGVDLNPSDFDFLDTSGKLFAAVHIAALSAAQTAANGGNSSIWVGAGSNGGGGGGGGGAPVPEPGTVLLLGTGLIGLASFGRRFKRN